MDITTLTDEQIATVRQSMGIVVDESAVGPLQAEVHRRKRQKTQHFDDEDSDATIIDDSLETTASFEESFDLSDQDFVLKRDISRLYNSLAAADTGTRSRYHNFVNDLTTLLTNFRKD